MTTNLQLPDFYKAAAANVSAMKAKNGLTGDLLNRMVVLDLNVKLGKLAQMAGLGEWYRTDEPHIKLKHSCMDEEADTLWCGLCHKSYDPKGEYEKHEDLLGRFHSLCPNPECNKNIMMGFKYRNPLLEAYADAFGVLLSIGVETGFGENYKPANLDYKFTDIIEVFEHLHNWIANLIVLKRADMYHKLVDVFLVLGELFEFDSDQIATAVMESIERQRQEAGITRGE